MARVVHDEPLWLEQGARLAVPHTDGLGSIVLATDAAQIVVERTTYTAFGVPVRQGSAGVQPFAYTGREWDVELGLYYYRARYYDPKVGRFLSRDPLGLAVGPNPYAYVQNSPTNGRDPMGLFCTGDFLARYYGRSGEPVDLKDVGLLDAFRNSSSVKTLTRAFNFWKVPAAVRQKAESMCGDCDKGTKSDVLTVGDDPATRPISNVTHEPCLFAVGHSSFFRSASCSVTANCSLRTCSFDCQTSFGIRDRFEKILDPYYRGELGGVPYDITADWSETVSGITGF